MRDMMFDEEIAPSRLKNCPSYHRLCPHVDPNDGLYYQISAATPHPRTIKTHLPFSLLHPSLLHTAKVVYVARDPKDVLVSYFHHCRLFHSIGFEGSLEQFFKAFFSGDVTFGRYDGHLKEAWEHRAHPNLLIVFYEDLQANILKEMCRLNTFLDTRLTKEQLKKVADYTSFSQMKDRDNLSDKDYCNQAVRETDGGFFRKGQSGDWKKRLPVHLWADMDAWITEHFSFGINFPSPTNTDEEDVGQELKQEKKVLF